MISRAELDFMTRSNPNRYQVLLALVGVARGQRLILSQVSR
jgi:hypothetical protein